eukprot:355035-Chlamydomonas_euryale.AAC.1
MTDHRRPNGMAAPTARRTRPARPRATARRCRVATRPTLRLDVSIACSPRVASRRRRLAPPRAAGPAGCWHPASSACVPAAEP